MNNNNNLKNVADLSDLKCREFVCFVDRCVKIIYFSYPDIKYEVLDENFFL